MLMRIRKKLNSLLLHYLKAKKKKKRARGQHIDSGCGNKISRERECAFSLDFRPFGPLVLDGARSKVDLRGEGYVWAPIWWSSDNSKR